jgi:hypothetical protein
VVASQRDETTNENANNTAAAWTPPKRKFFFHLFDRCKRKEPEIMERNLSPWFIGEGSRQMVKCGLRDRPAMTQW